MRPLPLSPIYELYLNDDFVDITSDVRQNPTPTISHGSKDEQPRATASSCSFTLNDRLGNYNRRNPAGEYFGSLGKSTPVRVRVPLIIDNRAQTVSNGWGGADPSGTVNPDSWTNNTGASSGGTISATNWSRSGTAKTHSIPAAAAYRISDLGPTEWIDSEVRFKLTLPTSNLTGNGVASIVKLRTEDDSNYVAVQFVFGVSETVSIGVFDKIAGTDRRLLADTEITGLSVATDQVFRFAVQAEGQIIRAKCWANGDPEPLEWQVKCTRATVRAGTIGLISNCLSSNTNTKPFLFVYDDFSVSMPVFAGRIAELNRAADDKSNNSRRVDVVAMNLQHGLEQGASPLRSPMYRTLSASRGWIRQGAATSQADVGDVNTLTSTDSDATDVEIGDFGRLLYGDADNAVYASYKEDQLFTVTAKASAFGFTNIDFTPDASSAIVMADRLEFYRLVDSSDQPICYWPCEDEGETRTIASGLPGGAPLQVAFATPEFAADSSFLGSAPLLKWNNAELTGYAPLNYDNTNEAFSIHFLVHMPETEESATGEDLLQWQTTGTGASWDLQYEADSDIRLTVFDTSHNIVYDQEWGTGLRLDPYQVVAVCQQSGPSTVTFSLYEWYYNKGLAFGTPVVTGATVTGVTTLGRITRIRANPGQGYVDVGFGHLAVFARALGSLDYQEPFIAYISENAPRRMQRLAYEEGVELSYCQGPNPGPRLGAQSRDTLLGNLSEVAATDLGLLYGARGADELVYLSRSALYDLPATLELDYSGGEVIEMPPVDDDAAIRNDITATQPGGSSARYVLESGPLSVADYVGRRDDEASVIAWRDEDLQPQAEWRVHLGTVDEDRFPTVKITAATGRVPMQTAFATGVGSRITVDNATAEGVYDQITQLVVGFTLSLDKYAPEWVFDCIPESPYHVLELDSDDALDSDDTTLNEDLDASETGVTVAVGGTLWDDADAPFDIKIGGERMTVTAVTGTSSPQTFTVTRNVNGVPAAARLHSTGDPVVLADRNVVAL